MEDIVLEASHISHSYDKKTKVLNDVNLKVRKGEFLSILGSSGSGKTTLLSILAGMEKPTEGEVFIDGQNILKWSERKLAILRRSKIGYVFQFFNLTPYLDLEDNILVPIYLAGKKKKNYQKELDRLISFFGLENRRHAFPSDLSGGEQQRTAVARELIYKPEMLFLDEPTGNLDSENSTKLMELLAKINKEMHTTILQVTHSLDNVKYSSRVIHIKDGHIHEEQA